MQNKLSFRLTLLVVMVLEFMSSSAVWSQSAQNEARVKAHSARQASLAKAQQRCFAVMGEVVKPGVYELKSETPYLVNLIRMSGGLTQSATGHLRIIRQGRTGQQTFYSPQHNLQLQPGDVIIADSKPDYQPKMKQLSHQSTLQVPASSESEFIQLGLVNLIDRPVVVKLRAEYASVPQLIRLMGQPEYVVDHVRVISNRYNKKKSHPLVNCSVVVFDKPVPDRKALPVFPATYTEETLTETGPSPVTKESPVLSVESESEEPGLPSAETAEQEQQTTSQLPVTMFSSNPEDAAADSTSGVEMLPAPGEEPIDTQPDGSHLFVEQTPQEIPQTIPAPPAENPDASNMQYADNTTDSQSQYPEHRIDPSVLSSNQANLSESSRASTFFLGFMLVLGGGILIWAVAPRKNSRHQAQPVQQQTAISTEAALPAQQKSLLSQLIDDELPILSEQVLFPSELNLYGRSTGLDKLRVDAAHTMPAPHITPRVPQPGVSHQVGRASDAAVGPTPGVRIDPPIGQSQTGQSSHIPLSPASSPNSLKADLTSFK